jgi:hypothetical protein
MGLQYLAFEAAGWIGAALILAAYILVSLGRLSGQSPVFQWMNIIGAAGMIANGWAHNAVPSVVLNVVWMGIGLFTVYRIYSKKIITE